MKSKFLTKIGKSVSSSTRKLCRATKKHEAELYIIAGIGFGITCTVLACKATLKVEEINSEAKEKLNKIDEELQKGDDEKYSKNDAKKDALIVYARTAGRYAKEYGPAVVCGILSIGCVTKGHNVMQKKVVALAAAYATMDASYNEYRKRVAEELGTEAEEKLFRGIKEIVVEEPILNKKGEDTGKTKKTKVEVSEGHGSPYSKVFDHHCNGWENGNPEYMDFFLRAQERVADQKLHARGYLFLNEVYQMLGMEPTIAGQSVGWLMSDTDDDTHIGDNKVSFDRYVVKRPIERDGRTLFENVHMIDFNVDGNILESVSLDEF